MASLSTVSVRPPRTQSSDDVTLGIPLAIMTSSITKIVNE